MDSNLALPVALRCALEGALSTQFGAAVRVVEASNFPFYSQVFRCTLESSAGAVPGTVIVRLPREGTAGRSEARRLDVERAALEYLAGVGSDLAPRFIAGGAAAGFNVSEDLGIHPSLLDILLGDDPEDAIEGALAFARGVGMLHAQTARQARLDGGNGILQRAPEAVATHWRQVQEAVAQLGLPAPSGVDEDVAAVTRTLAEPGDYLALSSGDLSVVNCKVAAGGVRFFDFEGACFRHALIDGALLRFLYPTGGPPWRLPDGLSDRLERAYREELARACPGVLEGANYEAGVAAASAAWMIIRMARLPLVEAGPDRGPWGLLPSNWHRPIPTRSRRRQLVSIIETTLVSARQAHTLDALAGWCERIAEALRARWPEATEDLPLYPAFDRRDGAVGAAGLE